MPTVSAFTDLTAFDRCSFNSVSGTYAERQVKEIDFLLSPNGDPAAIMFAGPASDFSGLQYPESRKFLKHQYPANLADSGSMQYFIEEHSERNSPYSYTVNAEEICDRSLPEIEEEGLLYPDGPVISFGYDYKLRVCVGFDYRYKLHLNGENFRHPAIFRVYEIISKNAGELDPLYEYPPVIFSRAHAPYPD